MKKNTKISNDIIRPSGYETRCYVVDKDGKVIVQYAHYLAMVSSVVKGPLTHVLIKYYDSEMDSLGEKNPVYRIYPKEQMFFTEWAIYR